MATTITADVRAALDVSVLLDSVTSPSSPQTGQNPTLHNAYSHKARYGSSLANNFPVLDTEPVDLSVTLGGSTADIDLTSVPLARDINRTISLNGKKLVALILRAGAENEQVIAIGPHPSTNPYNGLFGDGNSIELVPHQTVVLFVHHTEEFTNGKQAVGASNKVVRVTGTSGDTLHILALFAE